MKTLLHDTALEFILAGKSKFVVTNKKTTNQFTFAVSKSKDEKFYFVSGGSSKESLSYLGTINQLGYKHGKRSSIKKDSQVNLVFDYVFNKLLNKKLPEFIEISHYGFCGRCGRSLSVIDNINMGIGPECIKKLNKQDKREALINLILLQKC
jgi:hypothetical protein